MRWHGVLKQPPKCGLPWMLTWNNINQSAEITSGRQSSWGGLLWLHSWVFGHSHTGAVVVTAGQPCRHVAGRQRVILRELTLSQRVVAAKFLEEFEKNKKQFVISRRVVGKEATWGSLTIIMQKYLRTQKLLSELRFCVDEGVKPNARNENFFSTYQNRGN